MKMTPDIILQATGLTTGTDHIFEHLGLLSAVTPNTLSFLESEKYLPQLESRSNITGLFVTSALAARLAPLGKTGLVCDDPRYFYYTLYNFRARATAEKTPSVIHPAAVIHRTAYVSEYNVTIGANTVIEPKATVLDGVVLGEDCRVGAGTILGCEEAEIKKTSRGIFRVIHEGKLVIGDRVDISSNCTIDKGFYLNDTVIGDDTKIASTTLIGHSVVVGSRCLLLCCTLLGSVIVEDDARINPGAVISNQVRIGKGAQVSIGSVVVQSVPAGAHVTGYFAIEHNRFLYKQAKLFGYF